MGRIRAAVQIEGVVQGVGFRPFVYECAVRHGLAGWVRNDGRGVQIEVEGERARLVSFLSSLASPPPLARVIRQQVSYLPPVGYKGFEIRASTSGDGRLTLVSPDIATCEDCLRELFDPQDRRFRYPFINCTNCGPRFTIIEDIPYDRPKTTMAPFTMCPSCSREYHDPADRRFHAQPNACPACGPRVRLLDASGREVACADPIKEVIGLLMGGKIVAIKGIGGYHLACDPFDEGVVAELRGRKYREEKPFALMCQGIEVVERICVLEERGKELLLARERPIVILPRRKGSTIAPSVAPAQGTLGVMLPYAPLHHLLFADRISCLVMTSGNRSDEPIAYRDDEAIERLSGIADYFLVHDRRIKTRLDDSVVKPFRGRGTFIRRGRGYAPYPIRMAIGGGMVLACGAQLKNTFCLTKGEDAFVGQHIGDLENYETLQAFSEGIELFQRLFEIRPEVVVHDLHPDYLSTHYALRYAHEHGVEAIGVQHHHAHALSCMAEHGLKGPVLAVVMDGTGYGADGTIWGGEFLEVQGEGFKRLGHLRLISMPGGDRAAREPWRMGLAYLQRIFGDIEGVDIPFTRCLDPQNSALIKRAIRARINSPLCSSVGRLFDAVSALLGVRLVTTYEGQAAVELEQIAQAGETGEYQPGIVADGLLLLDPDPMVAAIVEDIKKGVAPSVIAARFHNGLAKGIVHVAMRLREETGVSEVVLSGGCFQNHLLLGRALDLLAQAGLKGYIQRQVPSNDGGISLGQAYYAILRARGE